MHMHLRVIMSLLSCMTPDEAPLFFQGGMVVHSPDTGNKAA